MALDLSLLASKLKKYREQFQASLTEVSAATGIPEDILSAFEEGQRQPTGDEILILADYYKCDYKFFISGERVAPFEETETLFRTHGEEFSKEDRRVVQEFLFLCECEEFLMRLLPGYDRSPFDFEKTGSIYKQHGEQAAVALRRHLGYSSIEVGMNVYDDLRRIGLHVFRRELMNSTISGLYIKHPYAGKCVLVNYSEDVYRQRFSAAHEAGHAILDSDKNVVVSFTAGRWKGSDLSEVRANTFASCYLMPPEFLRRIPDARRWDSQKAIEWAGKLRVSTEALAYALRDAGLIAAEAVEAIKAVKVSATDKVEPELPVGLAPKSLQRRKELLRRGLSSFYFELCFGAYEEGIISAGRLAEMFLLDQDELSEVLQVYGRSLSYAD